MTFNEETLDNIFAHLGRLDERLDNLVDHLERLDGRAEAVETRLDQLEVAPDNEHPDFDPTWDEPEDDEIEGLIDEEVVDYDAIIEGI